MSLIQKPFDDSGVNLVDDIARYGVAICRRTEQLKLSQSFPTSGGKPISSAAIAFAICDVIGDIVVATGEESYRMECARAAHTFALDSVGADISVQSQPTEAISPATHRELMACIKDLLREPDIIGEREQVTTQTILLALVWSALMFLAEQVAVEEVREWVKDRILAGNPA